MVTSETYVLIAHMLQTKSLTTGMWYTNGIFSYTPLHRACELCASLLRPYNWPGRRWKLKGGSTVALVLPRWYTGRSAIAMDAMVVLKFWTYSKQSQNGRRGGWSLNGRSNESEGTQRHRCGCRMDAQWSANGRHVIDAFGRKAQTLNVGDTSVSRVPPLCHQ